MSIRTYTKDMSYIKLRTPSNVEQLLLYESHRKKRQFTQKGIKTKYILLPNLSTLHVCHSYKYRMVFFYLIRSHTRARAFTVRPSYIKSMEFPPFNIIISIELFSARLLLIHTPIHP